MGFAVALQVEEQLGAVIVFPLAGVYRATAQADDNGHVLDSHRALLLAGAAGGALESRLLGNVCRHKRFRGAGAVGVEIIAQAERDLLGVENLTGIVGRTMLGTAAALHAGVGLQRDELGDVLAGIESENRRRRPGAGCG